MRSIISLNKGGGLLNKKTIILLLTLFVVFATVLVFFFRISDRTKIEDIITKDFKEHKTDFIYSAQLMLELKEQQINADTYIGNEPSIKKIFNSLGYLSIYKENIWVYFIRYSYNGFTQGLIYSQDNEQPESVYFTEIKKLGDNWFQFKSK